MSETEKKIIRNHRNRDGAEIRVYQEFDKDSAKPIGKPDIKRALTRIKKATGLPEDFRILHGLRHVYASILASSGEVDMFHLQKLLNHKSPSMTQRYAHLRDEALKNASNVLEKFIPAGK